MTGLHILKTVGTLALATTTAVVCHQRILASTIAAAISGTRIRLWGIPAHQIGGAEEGSGRTALAGICIGDSAWQNGINQCARPGGDFHRFEDVTPNLHKHCAELLRAGFLSGCHFDLHGGGAKRIQQVMQVHCECVSCVLFTLSNSVVRPRQ